MIDNSTHSGKQCAASSARQNCESSCAAACSCLCIHSYIPVELIHSTGMVCSAAILRFRCVSNGALVRAPACLLSLASNLPAVFLSFRTILEETHQQEYAMHVVAPTMTTKHTAQHNSSQGVRGCTDSLEYYFTTV